MRAVFWKSDEEDTLWLGTHSEGVKYNLQSLYWSQREIPDYFWAEKLSRCVRWKKNLLEDAWKWSGKGDSGGMNQFRDKEKWFGRGLGASPGLGCREGIVGSLMIAQLSETLASSHPCLPLKSQQARPSRTADHFILSQIPSRNKRALNAIISWNESFLISFNPVLLPRMHAHAKTHRRACARAPTELLSFNGKPELCSLLFSLEKIYVV